MLKVAQFIEKYEDAAKQAKICTSSKKPVHGIGRSFGDHGRTCMARVKKIGKDICRFTLKGQTTNYIY